MTANAVVNTLLESVDPALAKAMQQASEKIFAEETQMYGGGRPAKRRAVDGYDINCGMCEEWANDVSEFYLQATGRDDVEVLDPCSLTGDDGDYGHTFIRFNEMFYDAECPQGVADWKQLPLFVNNRAKGECPLSTDESVPAALNPMDEPSANFERFVTIIGKDYEGQEKSVLWKFKRAVKGYIKWVHTDDDQGKMYDDADMKKLTKAKTFAEAEAILAKYETTPSFMYMVRSGYFV